jgi:hypothetical protein
MTTATLSDGTVVDTSSPEWKAECLRKFNEFHPDSIHHAHLMNLKGIPGSSDRKEYLSIVQRREGKEAADRLRKEYGEWWEKGRKT